MENNQKLVIDNTYFLSVSKGGVLRWYRSNPESSDDRDRDEVDIARVVSEFAGVRPGDGSVVAVRIKAAILAKAEPFSEARLEVIRSGAEAYCVDGEGVYVEIKGRKTANTDFPFNAVAYCDGGERLELRKYDGAGRCSDGKAEHALIVKAGQKPDFA